MIPLCLPFYPPGRVCSRLFYDISEEQGQNGSGLFPGISETDQRSTEKSSIGKRIERTNRRG
ncbi:hypothetical protein GCWU000341_02460 [Oribacterium sp. oral taxon 078 str. F0262]|nr:hypothetical protein GCWU000341_02460 [Oribacterium sp. oral taxon 078 str. F0262]